MGINSTEVSYGFGQIGSGFTDTTGSLRPPSGRVIIAIQFVSDSSFSLLEQSTADAENAYIGTRTQDSDLQPGSLEIDSGNTFGAGTVIFGRWGEIRLATGSVIAYYGY